MTWGNRMRLLAGLVIVVAIALGATLVLSQRQAEVTSKSASIKALRYTIGSDYAGTVVTAKAKAGDTVKAGGPIMTIQSASLARDIQSKVVVPKSTAYKVGKGGTLTLLATQPGVVDRLGAQVGSFVSAGSAVATVDRTGTLYVTAEFNLDSYDFSRIQSGAAVDLILPNQQRLAGKVYRVRVTTVSGQAHASIEVRSAELKRGTADGLVAPGTPVEAVLHLRNDGLLGGLRENVLDLWHQVGL
jgi:multidrug resistance efflux pump